MPNITRIATNLKYNEEPIKAWKYDDLLTIVLVPGVNVNVDGSPRAYSVGNKGLANIQMGVRIKDTDGVFRGYLGYKAIYGHGFGSKWKAAEEANFAAGTDEFKCVGLYTDSAGKIIGNGTVGLKKQTVPGEPIEYYISTTSFTQSGFLDSDQGRYLDAGSVPAFVIPEESNDPLTIRLAKRQLAWSYYPSTKLSTFAVGGDHGPKEKFSEATIAFHQLLRYGSVLPIPHYKPNAAYVNKRSAPPPADQWVDCLYRPFTQKAPPEQDILRVSNLEDTIFVFFNKNNKVMDNVEFDLIQTRGQAELNNIGGLDQLKIILNQIPELNTIVAEMPNRNAALVLPAVTPPAAVAAPAAYSPAATRAEIFVQLAIDVGQEIPARRLVDFKAEKFPDGNPRYWAIADFGQHSKEKRLYVFDTQDKDVNQYFVSHGKGSDPDHDGIATHFSNVDKSNCTSLGIYRCAETYPGGHGHSMKLDGLEPSNLIARGRKIVLHTADYVSDAWVAENGKCGRSEGCLVVDNTVKDMLIDQLEGGSYVIAWHH
ncbi:MAG: murein L,D-transpeptidase catalytic domain family protein [Pyrinomonadaceae bacterium]